MISGVIQWRRRVKDSLLGKVKDLGDVDREFGGALYTCLHFLSSFNETVS
jgi:hypothetical protein